MNLKKAGNYSIGLDIGTNSVGWAVTDEDTGELYHYAGHPTWGSRLFPEAEQAADRRAKRGMRRRYDRRRYRINLLEEFFADEIAQVDENFFVRLKQSRLVKDDRSDDCDGLRCTFFNDEDYTDTDYYKEYPSIYHLRKRLVEDDSQADIRLVYLAMHHIVKYRGNFLRQGENLSSKNSNLQDSVTEMIDAFLDYCVECGWNVEVPDALTLTEDLQSNRRFTPKDKKIVGMFKINSTDKDLKKEIDNAIKCMVNAILGYKANFKQLFDLEEYENNDVNIYLSDDSGVEGMKEKLIDECVALFNSIEKVYAGKVLTEILAKAPGETLSANKVVEYNEHADQLCKLKKIFKATDEQNGTSLYAIMFDEGKNPEKNDYSYSSYVRGGCTQEDFVKFTIKLLQKGTIVPSKYKKDYDQLVEGNNFLKKLRTSENIVIPYQLHLEELGMIIDNQGQYYPFLKENKKEIMSLVEFRIPYYVGPLMEKIEGDPRSKFSWMVRRPGHENDVIYPWNADEIIDKEQTAAKFIDNLTVKCTYLWDKDTLPKHSLLYEEFCVLNELNGVRCNKDGVKSVRFDYETRQRIYDELFCQYSTVTVKRLEDWLEKELGWDNHTITGTQGESKFESSLSSYNKFRKIFNVDEIRDEDKPFIEELILYCTVFEDKSIRTEVIKRSFKEKFGELDDRRLKQIKKVAKIHYTGWGRLSKELLEMTAQTGNGPRSIIDLMREGDQVNQRALIFMEALAQYDFKEQIEEHNKDLTHMSLEDIPGSPAIRRGINQSIKIIDEIIDIAGKKPVKINLEVTRSTGQKGVRTSSKYKQIKNAMNSLDKQLKDAGLEDALDMCKSDMTEKQELYLRQLGKCAYSGDALDFNNLSAYHVDHVIPQAYTKDDSISNKVLCKPEMNEAKKDDLLIDVNVINKMRKTWQQWLKAGLISKKKYYNLTKSKITEKDEERFIARQIVQTSQIVKHTKKYIQSKYPDIEVVNIKAGMSSDLRKALELPKCRSVNNYHHAHDAFLANQISRYLDIRFDGLHDNPIRYAYVMRDYVERQFKNVKNGRNIPSYSFFIGGFINNFINKETGEVLWDSGENISYIKHAFGFKDCYITNLMSERSGSYWDESIYAAGDKKAQISLKAGGSPNKYESSIYLDPDVYGGKHQVQTAYFFLWVGNKKNGKPKVQLSIYPRYVKANGISVDEYVKELAAEYNLTNPKVLLSRVYSHQKVQYENDLLQVKAQDTFGNAKQLVLSDKSHEISSLIESGASLSEQDLIFLFDELAIKVPKLCSRMNVVSEALSERDRFIKLNKYEKSKLLGNLLNYMNDKIARVDLSPLGGSKSAGKMVSSGIWSEAVNGKGCSKNSSKLYIIDESVTGMRSRRRQVGI